MKMVPSSASVAEDANNFMMLQMVYIAPFRHIGALCRGIHTSKKCPDVQLLATIPEAYDTSEWMLRTILDVYYLILVSIWVAE